MKHISELLAPKMRELRSVRNLTLFDVPREKGSGEWRTWNAVRSDTVHAYHVRTPKKAIVVAQSDHTLRIVYPRIRVMPEM